MSNRIAIGSLRGSNGIWVTKPGYDVLTADSGDFLVDSNASTLYQVIYAGLTKVYAGGGSGATQSGRKVESLPAAAAPYSNMFVWMNWYIVEDGIVDEYDTTLYTAVFALQTVGGVLNVDWTFSTLAGLSGGDGVYVRWVVFRNSF